MFSEPRVNAICLEYKATVLNLEFLQTVESDKGRQIWSAEKSDWKENSLMDQSTDFCLL